MTNRKEARGFSLVETLIAMAILGSVILTVLTLFVLGRKNVYSGKQMSAAVAVGTRVLEDLQQMGPDDINSNFGLLTSTGANAVTLGNVSVAGVTYPGSTSVTTSTSTTTGYLGRWQALLPATFNDGKVTVVITPTDPTSAVATESIATAQYVRVTVIVQWRETTRPRTAVFQTVKIRRPIITSTT